MVHVQHGVLILHKKVFVRFSNGGNGCALCIVHAWSGCGLMLNLINLMVLVLYITCKHFPLFVPIVVTCMHKDLQNKGKACARTLDSDSRKLNWRRTVSWAILNNSRSEVLVEQSCTELSLLCRFSRQVPL